MSAVSFLTALVFLPVAGAVAVALVPRRAERAQKLVALAVSSAVRATPLDGAKPSADDFLRSFNEVLKISKERKIDMGLQPYPLSYEAEALGFSNLGAMAKLVPDYQFVSVMVDETWAGANRAAVAGFLKALRRGTEYMFAHPDESAELGAKELRTSTAFARRALEDTVNMDIISRDLSLANASMRRVFSIMQGAGAIPHTTPFEPARFVDESYLDESRR